MSCRVFWTTLGWLPAVSSHHLPGILYVAVLIVAMVRWLAVRTTLRTALLAPLLLLTSPRFFADAFNNLKDSPEAVLCTLALLLSARAVRSSGAGAWIAAGGVTGAALAQKANALFLPFELLSWIALAGLARSPVLSLADCIRPRIWLRGALAIASCVAVYFLFSPQFWFDTTARLHQHYSHVFEVGNAALGNGEAAAVATSRHFPPMLDGLIQLGITTPITLLICFVAGMFDRSLARPDRLLLTIATLFPIARTMVPGMVNFDGVRHFSECFPPMCMVAALGIDRIAAIVARVAGACAKSVVDRRVVSSIRLAAAAGFVLPGAWATVATHPNGTTYFNAAIGGLAGAQRIGDPEATDYWGNSYWQGVAWLDRFADRDAGLVVPVASHIVRAIAPVALRPDLRCDAQSDPNFAGSLYLMYITRPRFYGRFLEEMDRTHAPIHEIVVDGGVILRIHRFAAGVEAPALLQRFYTLNRDDEAATAIVLWAEADPTRSAELRKILKEGKHQSRAALVERLRLLLPPQLAVHAESFIDLRFPAASAR